MVEHNLAKVGVASSNLVSRSIILTIFFISFLYPSNTFTIKKRYCIKNSSVYLKDIFPHLKQNSFIINIPKGLKEFKTPSLDIISALKKIEKGDIDDLSGGVVTFDTQCFVNYHKDTIDREIRKRFKKEYPSIKIERIFIQPLNSFPKNFKSYNIEDIEISKYNLKKYKGTLCVVYKNQNRLLRLYFKFKIKAKITLLKAKNNITNGKILSLKDCEKYEVDFKKVPSGLLKSCSNGKLISRTFIKKGSVLSNYMFKKKSLIRKKQTVTAVLDSGFLTLEFDARALNDADLGDEIKVINKSGKVFKAKVVAKDTVEIE